EEKQAEAPKEEKKSEAPKEEKQAEAPKEEKKSEAPKEDNASDEDVPTIGASRTSAATSAPKSILGRLSAFLIRNTASKKSNNIKYDV
ncbi:hypothetical protein IJ182_05600, partial [bacterium]|nr:hypothetical protein [bacterium]